jgi:hypothetical protein
LQDNHAALVAGILVLKRSIVQKREWPGRIRHDEEQTILMLLQRREAGLCQLPALVAYYRGPQTQT